MQNKSERAGMPEQDASVLVIFEQSERLRDAMVARFPNVRFAFASRVGDIAPMLDTAQPQAVFSIKTPEFPGHLHREALAFPSVKWFSVGGSGYDHMLPWSRQDVTITNAAGVLARYLAETLTGAMLMINGNLHRYALQQRDRIWRDIPFHPVAGKTLLVVGVGAIGGYVADNAKALGMTVLGTRRSDVGHPSIDEMHSPTALQSLLPRADFVSLHVRLTDETRHMINAEALSLMKADATLINTARGGIVDELALIDALKHARLKAAYLDVFETEPLPADSPLWGLENAVLTPHASDTVADWPERFAAHFMDNLDRWLAGEALDNLVSQ